MTQRTYPLVGQALDAIGFRYDRLPEQNSYVLGVDGVKFAMACHAEMVAVYMIMSDKAPGAMLERAYAVIAHMNPTFEVGNFECDPRDGELRFKVELLMKVLPSAETVGQQLLHCFSLGAATKTTAEPLFQQHVFSAAARSAVAAPPKEDKSNDHPFIKAVRGNDTAAVAQYLKQGIDVNMQNDAGATALSVAAANGRTNIASMLLAYGANPNIDNNNEDSPLSIAVFKKHEETAMLILAAGGNPNHEDKFGDTPLLDAAGFGMYELVISMIARGANKNVVNKNGQTLLQRVQSSSDERLLAYFSDLTAAARGDTPLMIAVREGKIDEITSLIESKADVSKPNNEGNTPLAVAAVKGHTAIAQQLLLAGAEPNTENKNQDSPLSLAVFKKHPAVAMLLLGARADCNHVDKFGDTPLLDACGFGMGDVVAVMLASGANVNHKNAKGETALTRAVGSGDVQVVEAITKALARAGATPTAASGQSPSSAQDLSVGMEALSTAENEEVDF